jgi:hypothetical protein
MELEWNKVYHCNGDLVPEMKGDVTLSDLGKYILKRKPKYI